MHDRTHPCLPQVRDCDPWLDLYFGASFCEVCFERAVASIPEWPAARQGDAWAVAARGYATQHRPAEAMRAWNKAFSLGGDEVDALAVWLLPDGGVRAARRAAVEADPGRRADALCELAAVHLFRGELPAARAAVAAALESLASHGEAAHWQRFVDLPDAAVAAARLQEKPSRQGHGLAVRDARALLPTRGGGWVSEERLRRQDPFPQQIQAVPGSALRLLRASGVPETFLACASDWSRVPERHPLVAAELELDLLVSLVTEGRPAHGVAERAWAGACSAGDPDRVADVAQLLCALGTHDGDLSLLGREAARWLMDTGAPNRELFRGYQLWFAAVLGDRTCVGEASRWLTSGIGDDLSWRLALATLARGGALDRALAEIERCRHDPRRGPFAASLIRAPSRLARPTVCLSPRLTPRSLSRQPEAAA